MRIWKEAALRCLATFLSSEGGSKLTAQFLTGAISGGVRSVTQYNQVCLKCGTRTYSKKPIRICGQCGWKFPFK